MNTPTNTTSGYDSVEKIGNFKSGFMSQLIPFLVFGGGSFVVVFILPFILTAIGMSICIFALGIVGGQWLASKTLKKFGGRSEAQTLLKVQNSTLKGTWSGMATAQLMGVGLLSILRWEAGVIYSIILLGIVWFGLIYTASFQTQMNHNPTE